MIHLRALAIAAATFVHVATAVAADVVSLGTATPGGGFPVYGAAFAKAVGTADSSLKVEPRNTSGSEENIRFLEAGTIDLGLVQGEVAHEAFAGIGRKATKLRIISAMYASPGLFVVSAGSSYRSIRDLVGKPVAFGARGSGLVLLARYVLNGMGLDPDRDFEAIYLDRAGDGPPMLLGGRVAALWGGGLAWPGFMAAANQPGGARFLAPNAAEIDQVLHHAPFLRRLTVPAGNFPGQDAPIPSVGSWSFVLARADLPDEIAYRLAKALHAGEGVLAAQLSDGRQTTPSNTVAATPQIDLIHPGVQRFLREIGLVK
jgi:uncharacterized protein